MMFYKKTYNKKTGDKAKRKDSTEDLLEDLGNTVDNVRRNSLKVSKCSMQPPLLIPVHSL